MKNLLRFNIAATILLALLIVGILYVRAQTPDDEPCPCPAAPAPICPFPDPEWYSVFFPHPYDPHWFFHCSDGVPYCHECPADLVWNPELDTCDYGL